MAEVLDVFPVGVQGRRTWNYRQYLDGRIHRVVGGVDVANDLLSARNNFYITAARIGRKARVYVESHDPLTLVVQALPKDH